jgi:sterol desaturase/sphingolipid hydroxylase (fatty acid hydroxylase superfamily)
MNLSPVVIAIPMYFSLMAVELVFESITRRRSYRFNDAITNISTGTLQQLSHTFMHLLKIGAYTYVYENWALWHLERNWLNFALIFILWDFCYYWEHRFAHVVSLFWGGHSVHHQSEEYNLSVALRQSSTAILWGFPLYLPLGVLGFDPIHLALAGGLNLLYQFWIHTEHINRFPAWIEYIFNTPSHHRVHHGRDPKYLDKNYAGVFIIWDRLFGTFQVEEERPHYGVTKPVNTWNPVWVNFSHYVELFKALRKVRSVSDGLRILFMPPGWYPDYLGGFQAAPEVAADYQKYNQEPKVWIFNLYILVQFFAALAINSLYLFKNAEFGLGLKVVFGLWIAFTTLMFGFLFEKNSAWLWVLECLRLLSIPLGFYWMQSGGFYTLPFWILPTGIVFTAISIVALTWFRIKSGHFGELSPNLHI